MTFHGHFFLRVLFFGCASSVFDQVSDCAKDVYETQRKGFSRQVRGRFRHSRPQIVQNGSRRNTSAHRIDRNKSYDSIPVHEEDRRLGDSAFFLGIEYAPWPDNLPLRIAQNCERKIELPSHSF